MADVTKVQRVTAHAYALDWHRLAWLAIGAVAAAKYLDPWVLTVAVPALLKQLAEGRVYARMLIGGQRQSAEVEALLDSLHGAGERVQCSGGIHSPSGSAPERCAYEDGHEGECEA